MYSVTDRLKPAVHYLEELAVSQEGKAQHYWFHHQTWKYDPADETRQRMTPLHVESGCVKLMRPAGAENTGDDGRDQRPLWAEGTFVHPFSVTEIAKGVLNDDNTMLEMSASAEMGGFARGPAASGKKTHQLNRVWTLRADGRVLFKAGLKSESMPEVWEHRECVLEKVG